MTSFLLLLVTLTALLFILHCQPHSPYFHFHTMCTSVDTPAVSGPLPDKPIYKQGYVYKLNLKRSEEPLIDALQKLVFKNYGVTRDTDKYTWKTIPCHYLESQNVTRPYIGWADVNQCNYLFRLVGEDLVHPPSGIRSSVPLGGEGDTFFAQFVGRGRVVSLTKSLVDRVIVLGLFVTLCVTVSDTTLQASVQSICNPFRFQHWRMTEAKHR